MHHIRPLKPKNTPFLLYPLLPVPLLPLFCVLPCRKQSVPLLKQTSPPLLLQLKCHASSIFLTNSSAFLDALPVQELHPIGVDSHALALAIANAAKYDISYVYMLLQSNHVVKHNTGMSHACTRMPLKSKQLPRMLQKLRDKSESGGVILRKL